MLLFWSTASIDSHLCKSLTTRLTYHLWQHQGTTKSTSPQRDQRDTNLCEIWRLSNADSLTKFNNWWAWYKVLGVPLCMYDKQLRPRSTGSSEWLEKYGKTVSARSDQFTKGPDSNRGWDRNNWTGNSAGLDARTHTTWNRTKTATWPLSYRTATMTVSNWSERYGEFQDYHRKMEMQSLISWI